MTATNSEKNPKPMAATRLGHAIPSLNDITLLFFVTYKVKGDPGVKSFTSTLLRVKKGM